MPQHRTLGTSERLVDNLMEWESKFESADLEGHKQFLENVLPVCDSPLEEACHRWHTWSLDQGNQLAQVKIYCVVLRIHQGV